MLKHFRTGTKRIRTLWWVLTVGTVVTFLGGFVVFGNMGGGGNGAARPGDIIGRVDGDPITQAAYTSALNVAENLYQSQYGTTPQGRDAALLQEQVWTNLVTEQALGDVARRFGIGVSDPEVVFAARNTPPPDITQNPAFRTNNQFDRSKWQQALSDPSINWAPLEDRLRRILPAQRLEERVIAGVKISDPELRRLFRNQYDQARASVVVLPLDNAPMDSTRLSDAALRQYYAAHQDEYYGPVEVEASAVQIPRTIDEAAVRNTEAIVQGILQEARNGGDFAQLARERSQGPYAQRGGDLGQDVPVASLPPQLQSALAGMADGGVTDAIREGNTFFLFKLNGRTQVNGVPAVRLSQIQVPVESSGDLLQKDVENVLKIRAEAKKEPLATVAARHQLVTAETGWFSQSQFVPVLTQLPQAQQWALQAGKGDVSRAYAVESGWVLLQVTDRREAGKRPFEAVKDRVRSDLELSLRQQKPLAEAEKIVQAVRQGRTLEQAAAAAGVQVQATPPFARSNPAPVLTGFPRAVGLVFGLAPGQVGPPVAGPAGVAIVRTDEVTPADPARYDTVKGSLSSTLLSSRQQRYLRAWVQAQVQDAKVDDMRQSVEDPL